MACRSFSTIGQRPVALAQAQSLGVLLAPVPPSTIGDAGRRSLTRPCCSEVF